MQAETIKDEQFTLVKFSGSHLDSSNAAGLMQLFSSLVHGGEKNLILNMDGILKFDSEGINMLKEAHRQISEKNGSLVLCCLSKAADLIIRESAAEISVVPSQEEAVDLVLFNEIENQLRAESGEDGF
jgi:anti-anti-sigma factor